MKTIIVGAGPIGSYVASKKGSIIIEEHENIGSPVQCTGLVSKNVDEFFKPPENTIINKVRGARIVAPNGEHVIIKAEQDKAYVIDRKKFDQAIHEKTKDKSMTHVGETYLKHAVTPQGLVRVKTSKAVYEADLLIGADGPASRVARNIGQDRRVITGYQVRAGLDKPDDLVELYLGNDVCPGFFAWTVPLGDGTSRIGLATKNPKPYFKKFLAGLGVKKVHDFQAGVIPIGYCPEFTGEKTLLVGDAAGQVKSTTGGGIVTGLHSARILIKSLGSPNPEKEYEDEWNKTLGNEMRIHWWMRKWFNSLNNKQINQLLKVFKQAQLPLEMKGDMDYPSKYVLSLLTRPRVVFGLLKTMIFK